jgi:hypothetical protein
MRGAPHEENTPSTGEHGAPVLLQEILTKGYGRTTPAAKATNALRPRGNLPHTAYKGDRGEGFRMPARRDLSGRAEGRRSKVSQEGTAGAGRTVCQLYRRLTEFEPWANQFDHTSFHGSCREMIEGSFTRGLRPGQRWEFKEIRYHRPLTVRFRQELFPDAQFMIPPRDLEEVAMVLELSRGNVGGDGAEAIVSEVTYALLAIESGLDKVWTYLGPRSPQLDYRPLLQPDHPFVVALFGFLGLTVSESIVARIRKVLRVRAGATDREV